MKQYYRHNHAHPQTLLEEVQCEYTIGIPNGLFSSVPGLGIHTRLVGLTLDPSFNRPIRAIRCFGVSALAPSTPAVFFPWLSWVTLRTDIALAVLGWK